MGEYIAKVMINKIKRQPVEWNKVFSNHRSDKGLIPKTYQEFIQLDSKKEI